jgi:hypothetical protein
VRRGFPSVRTIVPGDLRQVLSRRLGEHIPPQSSSSRSRDLRITANASSPSTDSPRSS